MKGVRTILAIILIIICASVALGGEKIVLQKVQGDVSVRAGVTETWKRASAGETLTPDATLKTGKQSSALINLAAANKKIALPPEVMVDMSDIRELTQEELMLKLTMEKVRSSSYEWKNKEMNIPNTTIIHGEAKDKKESSGALESEAGVLQMNGTRVLFENGFYPTSALKALDVMRRYPSLGGKFENRLLVAQALEKSNLKSEALNEYVLLSRMDNITKAQREVAETKIAELKRQ